MIVCVCRKIEENDFDSADALRARIMEMDIKCGLCQLHYEINDAIIDTTQINSVNSVK